MVSLYQLADEYRELENMDIDPEALADTLESIEGEFDDKADKICYVLANLEGDAGVLHAEIKRLCARRDGLETRAANLKDYLRVNMEKLGKKKIESDLFTIQCVAGRDKVGEVDFTKLPDRFMYMPEVDLKLDKRMLLKELKEGAVEGAEMIKSNSSLRIK